ncbi:FecCD family ABC transporter permease [Pseudodesulfovibrio sediminis]|uniref:Iron ABC transporter permease n=1 Tax=Pseudodesulfovibrio sediminis TaxID=2810563 RepID=A0ABN6EWW5_9BACT|nr:iron ABC transporter permease [Pseudodesulfovibrio sediminis]BCS89927.1 iron ABC transporter permease [Pseudodesulfovibrio sediminis]
MKKQVIFGVLILVLSGVILLSFTQGRYPLKLVDIWHYLHHILFQSPMADRTANSIKVILFDIRLPRILAAVVVGAALSVSGTTFQAMFINPLVSPGILGVLAGASFGAALGMLLSSDWAVVQFSAFSFGMIAVGLAVLLSQLYKGDRLLLLILCGVISGALFTALLSIIKYLADPYDQLPAIVYWLMGGFSMINLHTISSLAPGILVGIVVIIAFANKLNLLTMGDEEARSLGVRVRTIRLMFIVAATLISSLTVVIGGIIGWVGLVIPHMSRMIVGPDNRFLLPCSALIGALFLLVVDNVSRQMFTVEIPLGILTSLLGIPAFVCVLRGARKGWS